MKRSFNFVMQNIGGVKLLIPLGSQVADSNGVITLNNTAAYIWELLAQEHSVEELSTSVAIFLG